MPDWIRTTSSTRQLIARDARSELPVSFTFEMERIRFAFPRRHEYPSPMTKLQSIQSEAVVLSQEDRAALVAVLLDSFGGPEYDVSDADVATRDEEMESGAEPGLPHDEFVRAMRRNRRR